MAGYTVGKDVLSFCSRCKLTLSHVIVSMQDSATISKVQCNTCKGMHMYKDPSNQGKKVRSKTFTPGVKNKSISVGELWNEEMAKSHNKPKDYSIRAKFVIGDLIDHKQFGPGIVQNLVDGKIEVLFRHEIKTLIHNKA